ncbi:MAG: hypothetical protein ABMB14_14815 [Myxococcota bacterium]
MIGEIDLGRAVADGFAAVVRNAMPAIGVVLLGIVVYLLSFCTCVGWIVGIPVLFVGLYRFLLAMVDGQASVSDATRVVDDFGGTFTDGWGVALGFFVLYLPMLAVGVAIGVVNVVEPGTIGPIPQNVGTSLLGALYGFLAVRFVFTPWLVFEGRSSVIAAFGQSWRMTARHWGKLCGLQLLALLIGAPAQVTNLGAVVLMQDAQTDPARAIDALMNGMALMSVGSVIAAIGAVFSIAFFAAAYRQLVGPAPVTG